MMKSAYTQQSLVKLKLRQHPIDEAPLAAIHGTPTYDLDELTCFTNEDFVTVAYNTLLRRAPDADGQRIYLEKLAAGTPKAVVVCKLRYSAEGRQHHTVVNGLFSGTIVALANRVPVLGWLVESLVTLVTLPRLNRKLRQLEASRKPDSLRTDAQRDALIQQLSKELSILKRSSLDTTPAPHPREQ